MPALVAVLLVTLLIAAVIVIVYCRIRIRILRVRLRAEMYNKAEIANFLNLFSRNIQKMDNAENWMNVTARYVADLVEAQSVCIFVLEPESNQLKAAGIVGAFPLLRPVELQNGIKPKYTLEAVRREKIAVGDESNIAGTVAATMNPVLIDVFNDPRLAGLEAVDPVTTLMAVPMIYEGKCTGVICAVENRRSPDNPFETDQFNRMKFIAGQIVLAQNILAAYSNLGKQQRLNQELDFARSLQSSLLPERFPDWGSFRIHAFTRASKEVSGDFYDYVEIDENRSLVVIGDACGKGIPACMIMA
ncbi:MAG: GAF domain-containing protein, partial [Lentisphaeria bacterium]|nr:GAF domain-containing protein [Lentisphaeria bacterium]